MSSPQWPVKLVVMALLKLPLFLGLALKKEGGSSHDGHLQTITYFYSVFKKFERGLLGLVFGLGSHELAKGNKMHHLKVHVYHIR